MSDRLLPCSSCRRHVASDEVACPFCGVELPATSPPRPMLPGRFSRAAVFAGATLAGCWTNSNEPRTTPIEQHDDHGGSAKPNDVTTKDDTKHVDVAPPGTLARIEGTITDSSTGQPAGGIQIVLSGGKIRAMQTTTDMNGHYVFTNLEPGAYTLTWGTNNPHQSRSVLQANVTAGAVMKLDMTVFFPQNNSNIPMPYGAPPARYRFV